MNEQEWIQKLEQEGWQNVSIFRSEPNMVFGMHTHNEHTVHVILLGELIITDQNSMKTIPAGGRIEFPVGTTHSAMAGPGGCVFVLGVRK
ncbi:MAG: hypothetical protein G01um101448_181 [Parcubacteria group bacterium Gr01-1014_48]|nr:MAG: hypothetical protein Greene041614_729 [Parcubacteria group bacterium Greene0416_14]TSC74366.1 MAG: hypothetical protein G01um101448_181 [Parcubacteria group bacterium Gr01-1014_48]TSD00717.1 MAG: hypothetical protein Greene101415_717 [Parcubacteria group bacterium Greene1014_15]TSD07688.1 MAG: hypothetical protein Greene07144_821 [Parcubacteria group bacterium Greene0714_4]